MADEINISLNVDVSSGNYRASFRPGTIQPDMATITGSDLVQTITTSAFQALGIGASVSAGGYFWFRNLDTSTSTTFDPSIKISIGTTNAAATSTTSRNTSQDYKTWQTKSISHLMSMSRQATSEHRFDQARSNPTWQRSSDRICRRRSARQLRISTSDRMLSQVATFGFATCRRARARPLIHRSRSRRAQQLQRAHRFRFSIFDQANMRSVAA